MEPFSIVIMIAFELIKGALELAWELLTLAWSLVRFAIVRAWLAHKVKTYG